MSDPVVPVIGRRLTEYQIDGRLPESLASWAAGRWPLRNYGALSARSLGELSMLGNPPGWREMHGHAEHTPPPPLHATYSTAHLTLADEASEVTMTDSPVSRHQA